MRERGFTLLEALVATAVFSITLVAAMSFYVTNRNLFNAGQSRADAHQNARVALEAMAREMRVAGYDPANTIPSLGTNAPIQTAQSDRLTFVADVTAEGTLDQVTYRLVGTRIVREFSSWGGSSFPSPTSGDVAEGITSLTFSYFDGSSPNVALAAPVTGANLQNIRKVTLALVTAATTVDAQATYPLVVDVEVRN